MLNSVFARKQRKWGFRTLLDLGTMNIKYPQSSMLTRQDVIEQKRDPLRRFMRAYFACLQRFVKDRALGIDVLTKFTPVKDETIASQDYDEWTKKYLDLEGVTTKELISGPLDQIGINREIDRERIFLEVVDNSLVKEGKAGR